MAATEAIMERVAFELWTTSASGDNLADLERVKRALPIVLEECVTEKERLYILAYFAGRKKMHEIAYEFGVNKSTVSRVIRRGLDKSYKYLRFVSPLFMHTPQKRGYLRQEC